MYLYETHLHTSEASRCGKRTGAEMARSAKEAGYQGVFVTDHFFNGSSSVPKDIPYSERVEMYMKGYEAVKAEGDKIGLDVFFGLEFNYFGTELLIYGITKEFLLSHPEFETLDIVEAARLARSEGFFVVHPHPFRQRKYINTIRLIPDCVDAVETVNSAHNTPETAVFDERADQYANSFSLPKTGGSDIHRLYSDWPVWGGVETEKKLTGWQDYRDAVLSGEAVPFRKYSSLEK